MTVRDDGESIGLFEPLVVSEGGRSRQRLNDLALTLLEKSTALSASVSSVLAPSLANIVRTANSYYSNLIEGHLIHPIGIEQAMHDQYSHDARTRDLQLEARAHITVQKWIDDEGISAAPFSIDFICEVHRRLCKLLPSELLMAKTSNGYEKIAVEPGAFRARDVKVGRHVAISSGSVPRFLSRMEQRYQSAGEIDRILIAAFGHHRLLWVHPFLDGNGRVARLVSHAALRSAVGTKGLWSVARGLARREREYRMHLQSCDEPRRGSLDGRGSLSEAALANFAEFFLGTCINEVDFMSGLTQRYDLRDRALTWAHEEMRAGTLPPRADIVLTAILDRGELQREEIMTLTGTSEMSARWLTAALTKSGVVQSETESTSIRLAFPVKLATRLLPGLFEES